jgi:hypothetical protein
VTINRQRAWQLKQFAAGNCVVCGKPALAGGRCAYHILLQRKNQRKTRGSKRRYKVKYPDKVLREIIAKEQE